MKTMTYMMMGGLMMAAVSANAAGMGAGASVGGNTNSGGASVGASVGTGVGAGRATNSGTGMDTGLNAGMNADMKTGATGTTRPSGLIDDTGRSGTSSISTQSDAKARMNTPSRAGTLSGRPSTLRADGTVGVSGSTY